MMQQSIPNIFTTNPVFRKLSLVPKLRLGTLTAKLRFAKDGKQNFRDIRFPSGAWEPAQRICAAQKISTINPEIRKLFKRRLCLN